jgi:hypothetical protein
MSSDVPFRILAEFSRQHDIPLCDLSEGFRQLGAGGSGVTLFQRDRAELSPAGHELVAKLLAERLGGPRMAWWIDPDRGPGGDRGGKVVPVSSERAVESR